jgi:hypothetical protein
VGGEGFAADAGFPAEGVSALFALEGSAGESAAVWMKGRPTVVPAPAKGLAGKAAPAAPVVQGAARAHRRQEKRIRAADAGRIRRSLSDIYALPKAVIF